MTNEKFLMTKFMDAVVPSAIENSSWTDDTTNFVSKLQSSAMRRL